MRGMYACLAFTSCLIVAPGVGASQRRATNNSRATRYTFDISYAFQGQPDGANPEAGVIQDAAGNSYGTTYSGGTGTCYDNYTYGCGTIFKLDVHGKETVLYSFAGNTDGKYPSAPLILDKKGNLYGTTLDGGRSDAGIVFRLTPEGTETVLHSFDGSHDGANPFGGLVRDRAGNLYGTTAYGGAGYGVVFKLDPAGHETVLHRFANSPDGASPLAGLILDNAGSLYGTTEAGGAPSCDQPYGCGIVFKLDSAGRETILHTFAGVPDGAFPSGRLLRDTNGNVFGTTQAGGRYDRKACPLYGCGTVFRLSSSGEEQVLFRFGGAGVIPEGALVMDASGNLYGTTARWGGSGCDCGLVFRLNPKGNESILHYFIHNRGGAYVNPDLWRDSSGDLFGTTLRGTNAAECGGYGCGTVFRLTPAGDQRNESTLAR